MIVALFQFCVSKKNIYNILKCTPIYILVKKKKNTSIACIQIKIVVAINVKIYYNKKII